MNVGNGPMHAHLLDGYNKEKTLEQEIDEETEKTKQATCVSLSQTRNNQGKHS